MYHLPLRASAAIASGVALVSLFGAASPALAKGGHHHRSHAPATAAAALEIVAPATPAADAPALDTPAVDPSAPTAPAADTPAVETPPVETPPVETPPVDVPAADPLDCVGDPAVIEATTPGLVVNSAGDAGCVAVVVTDSTIRLAWVAPASGWTYEVEKNGGGTNDRVEIRFTQADTDQQLDFRYELGKTSIG
jgi:hypothetical protein